MIKKWSYSRWACYHACPHEYEGRYILKIDTFKESPAMVRGTRIHKLAENYVQGLIKTLPKELMLFKDEFKELRAEFKKGTVFVEPDVSMNRDFTPSDRKNSDWFVGFLDCHHYDAVKTPDEMYTIDYKTGRHYPTHRDQGHAYNTALLAMNPQVKESIVAFYFLDDKDESTNVTEFVRNQSELPKMLQLWDKRINTMYADTKFKKTPHKWCKYCHRNVNQGGECKG